MRENSVVQHQQGFQRNSATASGRLRHFMDTIWRPFIASKSKSYTLVFLLVILLLCVFISTRRLLDPTAVFDGGLSDQKQALNTRTRRARSPGIPRIQIPLNCTTLYHKRACPRNYPKTFEVEDDPDRSSPPTCPEYFRWIHEDLRPWARKGITREMVERAQATANFRLAIINGRVYMERFHRAFQTRDVFTLWGVLQLLRRYPGKLPDLELMFDCVDWPVIKAVDYSGPNATDPPPLFRYCGNDETLDIVFPDWSFWGCLITLYAADENMIEFFSNFNIPAYVLRILLLQDWLKESREGYKESDLTSQCTYRYKIYIEGSAWSVSEKYILACDSVTFLVKLHYYDFFTRGLIPLRHYWPVKEDGKCRSLKFAVDWGNSHKQKAQEIGKGASRFIQEELKMDYVYDYMFHLFNEYAKLLRFKPAIPQNAVELCVETMACPRNGTEKKFMEESLVKGPAETEPCTIPPPYDPPSLLYLLKSKEKLISQVDFWEKKHWQKNQTQ
ncbi:O-glucosyltransferase rumi homolog [Carica papaya]|uniref:O-glucosyltransferase rumi homolog n=1 Tax=Carica papaya TaxID=3649 RepID=UPI000B8D1B17|nr:O-glucosyltransferase rumi homolog [Carica papaya]